MFSKDVPPYDFFEFTEFFRSKTLITSSFIFGSILFSSLRDKSSLEDSGKLFHLGIVRSLGVFRIRRSVEISVAWNARYKEY